MSDHDAKILIGSSPVGGGKRHTYLIFEGSDGQQTIVRGGPMQDPDGDAMGAMLDSAVLGTERYGSIKVSSSPYQPTYKTYQRENGDVVENVPVAEANPSDPSLRRDKEGNPIISEQRGIDWPLQGETHERRVLWTGTDAQLQAKLGIALQVGQQITQAGLEYAPLSNNCNNVSTALLKAVGVTPGLPVMEDGTAVSAPAFGEPLHQNIGPAGWRSGYRFDGKTWMSEDGLVIPPPIKPKASGSPDNAAPPPPGSGSSGSAQIDEPTRNSRNLLDPANADHGLYLQAYAGVAKLDARFGRTPDLQSQQLAAALAVQGKADGLTSIQQVLLNDDGTRAFAVDNADASAPWARRSSVEVMAALQQPLEESTARMGQANARAAEQRDVDVVQAQAGPRVA